MKVVGLGAGGHARVVVDIARRLPDVEVVGLLDPDSTRWGTLHAGVPILGGDDLLGTLAVDGAFVGIGGVSSNAGRRRACARVRAAGLALVSLVHPSAVVGADVCFGEGVTVMGGVVINPSVVLGEGVIVNTGAVVEHDCRLEAYAHLCPRSVIGGGVVVGEEAFVGIGATVIQAVRIGARAVVGAGAVVVRDVDDDTLVVGCPARAVRRLDSGR